MKNNHLRMIPDTCLFKESQLAKIRWYSILSVFVFSLCLIMPNKRAYAESEKSKQEIRQTQTTISGKITDSSGEPLPGVTVIVKETTIGTITDFNGKYSLSNVPEDAILVFSFIGMKTQEMPVGRKTTIDIVMQEASIGLEEVVAVGYGVQKKSNVTGSIASVHSDEIANRSTEDVGHAMQGKVAGVQVLATSGAPNAETTFRVRGYSNTSSSDPLYIVDGLKVSSINYLSSESIESIEVLKDAASAAIYGAEAGNGVVLITTKSGSGNKGNSEIFYNMQHITSYASNQMNMMNAAQFKEYWMESGRADQSSFGTADTDWQDVVFDKGHMQLHTLGIQGSNEQGSMYVSLSYLDNDGIVVGNKDKNERITAQVNAKYKFKPWLTIGTTNSIERGETSSVSESNFTGTGSVIGGAYYYDPTVPIVYENDSDAPSYLTNAEAEGYNVFRKDGKIYGASALMQSNLWNPLGMIDYLDTKNYRTNINGTIYGDLNPIKYLTITSRLGYRINNDYTTEYQYPYYWNVNQVSENGTFEATTYHKFYFQWENFASYLFTVGKNDFSVMAGMQYARNNVQYQYGYTDKLTNEDENYRYLNYSSTSANDQVEGNIAEESNISYFTRLSWTYDNRYTFQGIFRADAYDTSKLSKDNRWGYFPSVSAAWNVMNESFMEDINTDILSNLKVRASWGINGNISSLSDYPYSTTLSLGGDDGNYYSITNESGLITGAYPSDQLENTSLTWEESKQIDIGFDSRFFNDRLSFTFDYYHKTTTNMLSEVDAPYVSGCTTRTVNGGKIENSGFEFDLSWRGNIGDFKYSIDANLATVKNKVIESPYGETGRTIGGYNFYMPVTYMEAGFPIWYIRTYITDHIDEKTGLPVYKTAEELGTDDGKDYVGSGIPDFTYGLTLNFEYKNFDLKVFGTGVYGNEMFLSVYRPDLPIANLPEYLYTERWTSSNTNANYPKANQTDAMYSQSDLWVHDASYFKVKQIQLGYTFPSINITQKAKISSLRTFLSLENFFTFTSYPGNDPESMSSTGGASFWGGSLGIDKVSYPSMKQIVFGVNLTF